MDFNHAAEATESFPKKQPAADTVEFGAGQPADELKNLMDFVNHERTMVDGDEHVGAANDAADSDDDDSANFSATFAKGEAVRSELHVTPSQVPRSAASDAHTGADPAERIDNGWPQLDDDDVARKSTPTNVEEPHSSDEETNNADDDLLKMAEETRPLPPDHTQFASTADGRDVENRPAADAFDEETKKLTAPTAPKTTTEPLISFETTPSETENLPKHEERISLTAEKPSEIGPKDFFSKYGLDTWFRPECLNPTVEAFIYWRDPKLSGIIFGSGLVLLLSLAYFSVISVVANTALGILTCSIVFRIYKDILQAVQKSPQTHPYSVFLHQDIKLPQEKVHELVDTLILHVNACIGELRRLFLVEDMIESLKFALVLWVLTYVGSWFNGLTLVIVAFVSLFTLPKVYENNKVQIDQNLALVRVKLEELTNRIKDALPAPLRRKSPEKKE